jgi:hypothetical protein
MTKHIICIVIIAIALFVCYRAISNTTIFGSRQGCRQYENFQRRREKLSMMEAKLAPEVNGTQFMYPDLNDFYPYDDLNPEVGEL